MEQALPPRLKAHPSRSKARLGTLRAACPEHGAMRRARGRVAQQLSTAAAEGRAQAWHDRPAGREVSFKEGENPPQHHSCDDGIPMIGAPYRQANYR